MTVTYKEYAEDKKRFFEKHDYAYRVDTSPINEYGVWFKTYHFENNAVWEERMSPEYETAKVEIKKVLVKVEVKMLKTEYWSTEEGSKYYYEKF